MKIVKDTGAFDGKNERLVGTKITRINESIQLNPAQWNAAWYLWDDGHWVTLGTKAHKMAVIDSFDVRKLFIEDPEFVFVGPDDPDWAIWATIPAPGQRNGPSIA